MSYSVSAEKHLASPYGLASISHSCLVITQVLQGQSPLDQSTNHIALQFCNLTSSFLKKKQEVFKTLQSRIWKSTISERDTL